MDSLEDILNTLIAEAYGEGDEGMRRVGETILNRGAIRGLTPAEVVRQRAQYTGYSAPGPAAVAAQQDPRVRTAAEAAWNLARQPGDPTQGADHYFNPNIVDPGWQNSMEATGDYGGHSFYRSREVPADALRALLQPVAPVPFMPPARGNVPSRLVADSFSALPQRQQPTGLSPSTIKSVVDMFAEPVRDATPRMNSNGGVTDTAGAVFGSQMEKNIWPQRATARLPEIEPPSTSKSAITSASARAAADLLTMRKANQQNADAERNKTVVASFPTTGVGQPPATRNVQSVAVRPSASDLVRGKSAPTATQAIATAFSVAPNYNPAAHGFAGGAKMVPGPNAAPKKDERLPASSGIDLVSTAAKDFNPYGAEVVPLDASFVPMPRKRPETRTITEQVPNPDWTAGLAPAGMKLNFGSRDTVAQRAAGAKVPQFITRTRQVPVAAPAPAKVAPVPFSRPAAPATRAPLRIVVNGGNVTPQAAARSLYHTNPIAFGNAAVAQSGDNSSGSQAEAAAARASGQAWRDAQARK